MVADFLAQHAATWSLAMIENSYPGSAALLRLPVKKKTIKKEFGHATEHLD
jgi:hypothetical protein